MTAFAPARRYTESHGGGACVKTVIYVDVLLLVNFIVAYFLLRAAGIACGAVLPFWRNVLGAGMAALSTLVLLLPPMPLAAQLACKAACGMAVVRAAFPWRGKRPYARLCCWYTALNLGLAGVLIFLLMGGWLPGAEANNLSVYLAISPPVLFWGAAGVYFALRAAGLLLPGISHDTQNLNIYFPGASFSLQVLCDTGFSLHEPISGQPVLLASFPLVQKKLPPEYRAFLSAWFSGQNASPPQNAKFRLVPMGTAAGSAVLPAFLLPITASSGQTVPVAFSPQKFGGGAWEALAAPELLQNAIIL